MQKRMNSILMDFNLQTDQAITILEDKMNELKNLILDADGRFNALSRKLQVIDEMKNIDRVVVNKEVSEKTAKEFIQPVSKEIVEENIELKIKKETKLILEKIPKNSHVIYLSLYGKKMDSIEFSKMLDVDNLTFIIGGSNGVDETYFLNKISFSDLTFPHQLFRIMLVEQIFRGFAIKNNIKYHK